MSAVILGTVLPDGQVATLVIEDSRDADHFNVGMRAGNRFRVPLPGDTIVWWENAPFDMQRDRNLAAEHLQAEHQIEITRHVRMLDCACPDDPEPTTEEMQWFEYAHGFTELIPLDPHLRKERSNSLSDLLT